MRHETNFLSKWSPGHGQGAVAKGGRRGVTWKYGSSLYQYLSDSEYNSVSYKLAMVIQ
ncbi:hypothetical protein RB213_010871, partial [Colletotrichum asianum]